MNGDRLGTDQPDRDQRVEDRSGEPEDPDLTPPSGIPLSAHPAWGPPATWPPSWDVPRGGRTLPPAGPPVSPRRAAGSTGSMPTAGPVPAGPVPTTPVPASSVPTSTIPEEERTRNGLRKRTPRVQRVAEPVASRRVIDLDAVDASRRPATRLDDSPSQVGARLTALRAGLQRGQTPASKETE